MNSKQSVRSKHIDFIIWDLLSCEIAFLLACLFRYDDVIEHLVFYRNINIIILVAYIMFMIINAFHSDILKRDYLKEIKKVFITNLEVVAALVGILFIFKESAIYSRLIIGFFFVFSNIIMFTLRTIWKNVLRRRFANSVHTTKVLLVTSGKQMDSFYDSISKINNGSFEIGALVVLDDDKESVTKNVKILNSDEVLNYAKENVVNDVYISADPKVANELTDFYLSMGIRVHIVLDTKVTHFPNYTVDMSGECLMLSASISRGSIPELILKRLFDIFCGLFGLIFTGILMIFVAPIIKIQSPGPVFFAQNRVGKNGKIFKMYKFRSMYLDAEERKKELMAQNEMKGLMFKMDNDPRIFPAGKFIRKTSIDEFPQFWNILKGDMSLVGTRPPTLDEFEQYAPHHLSRLAIKPGLTGMWQTAGRSDITDFEEIVQLDNDYIRNFSLGLDVKIIFKTFLTVLKMKGSK